MLTLFVGNKIKVPVAGQRYSSIYKTSATIYILKAEITKAVESFDEDIVLGKNQKTFKQPRGT